MLYIGVIKMHPKPKRNTSKKNLALVRAMDCFICGTRPVDVDHIKSRGAGGGDDLPNLQALCRSHHVERHTIGIKQFLKRYYFTISQSRSKYDLPELNMKDIIE